jgi:hypothetical protein
MVRSGSEEGQHGIMPLFCPTLQAVFAKYEFASDLNRDRLTALLATKPSPRRRCGAPCLDAADLLDNAMI